MDILKSVFGSLLTALILAIAANIAISIGDQKKAKLLLQIGTLPLPVLILGSLSTWLTAQIVVLFNPFIVTSHYVTWIAFVVGVVVFGYTVLWFLRISSWVDKRAEDAARNLEEKKAKEKGKE